MIKKERRKRERERNPWKKHIKAYQETLRSFDQNTFLNLSINLNFWRLVLSNSSLCSNAPPKCRMRSSFFVKGKLNHHDFLVGLFFYLWKWTFYLLNTSILKDERHLFHQKDLTVLVLIPHLTQVGFKFPSYRQGQQSNTHGLLVGVGGGVCWIFKLTGP